MFRTVAAYGALVLFAQFLNVATADACSMSGDFVRPTNFELVQLADAIVVATAAKQTREGRLGEYVRFRVDQVVKGHPPNFVMDAMATLGSPSPSDPKELSSAHPEAYSGPCNRVTFKKGNQYVLFLVSVKSGEFKGRYFVGGAAFSRISEDHYGEESLWMRTIRYYLKIQNAYDAMKQLEVLQARYAQLVAKDMTADERKLAADIADHLMSRSPYKPTEYLLQSYRALEEGRELPFAVRSPAADKEGSQAEALAKFITGRLNDPDFDVEAQKTFILWSLVNGDHPGAMPLFKRLAQSPAATAATLGAAVEFLSKHGQYRNAINIVNSHAFRIMNNFPYEDVREFLRGVITMHYYDGDYKRERWKEDEYAKRWWPDFALAINSAIRNRFGPYWIYSFDDEAAALRPKDYRSRPDVVFVLAHSHDEAVVSWAEKEVQSLLSNDEKGYRGAYRVPIGILLEDYDWRNQGKIDKLFCSSDTGRYVILKYLGEHENSYTNELPFRLAAFKLKDEEKKTLINSLTVFAADEWKGYMSGQGGGFGEGFELIMALAKGDPIDLKERKLSPIKCD